MIIFKHFIGFVQVQQQLNVRGLFPFPYGDPGDSGCGPWQWHTQYSVSRATLTFYDLLYFIKKQSTMPGRSKRTKVVRVPDSFIHTLLLKRKEKLQAGDMIMQGVKSIIGKWDGITVYFWKLEKPSSMSQEIKRLCPADWNCMFPPTILSVYVL